MPGLIKDRLVRRSREGIIVVRSMQVVHELVMATSLFSTDWGEHQDRLLARRRCSRLTAKLKL